MLPKAFPLGEGGRAKRGRMRSSTAYARCFTRIARSIRCVPCRDGFCGGIPIDCRRACMRSTATFVRKTCRQENRPTVLLRLPGENTTSSVSPAGCHHSRGLPARSALKIVHRTIFRALDPPKGKALDYHVKCNTPPKGEAFAETASRIIDGFNPIDKPLAIHYHGRSDSSQEGDGHGLQAAV